MLTCSRCGSQNPADPLSCRECGQPFPASRWLGAPSAAKILGIISVPLMCVFGVGFFTGLLAVVLGAFELARARRAASSEDRRAAITGIVLGTVCVSFAVLISLPGLLASRVRQNEVATLTDVRTIIMAEVEYAKVNGDYDSLECVTGPARCIPGYDAAKPGFLEAALAVARLKSGYHRTFHAGPAPVAGRAKGSSPTSIAMFAYVAVPESPGSSGRRSFCGDGTGRVCVMEDGAAPAVSGGMCAESCPTIR